jgi:hypothetical protein
MGMASFAISLSPAFVATRSISVSWQQRALLAEERKCLTPPWFQSVFLSFAGMTSYLVLNHLYLSALLVLERNTSFLADREDPLYLRAKVKYFRKFSL